MTASQKILPKVVVIVGPTASGKTANVLHIAQTVPIEVISADSRQVYKKMNIGTAKPNGEWQWRTNWRGLRHSFYVDGVPHHLIDFVDPGKRFTVAEFRDKAIKYIKLSYKNNRYPFIVGGTGLYISSLVDNYKIPRIAPNLKLRKSLEEKSHEQLILLLTQMDPVSAGRIDYHNKRRMIRALEVCILTGDPFSSHQQKGELMFNFLQVGIEVERSVLYERINQRIDEMIAAGLVEEIELLVKQKYSWKLPSMSGIGYRQFKEYFEGTISLPVAIERLKRDTRRYARRQMSWFRRDPSIEWFRDMESVEERVKKFLYDEEQSS